MFGLEAKVLWLFVFVALYWSYCIYWGIKGARQSKTAGDYFIAGRSINEILNEANQLVDNGSQEITLLGQNVNAYNHKNKKLSGTIAVVGNGPISEEDRKNINKFDTIIRFNDMKNKNAGEKTSIQVVRQISPKDDFFGKSNIKRGVPIILIATKKDYAEKCKQKYKIK